MINDTGYKSRPIGGARILLYGINQFLIEDDSETISKLMECLNDDNPLSNTASKSVSPSQTRISPQKTQRFRCSTDVIFHKRVKLTSVDLGIAFSVPVKSSKRYSGSKSSKRFNLSNKSNRPKRPNRPNRPKRPNIPNKYHKPNRKTFNKKLGCKSYYRIKQRMHTLFDEKNT